MKAAKAALLGILAALPGCKEEPEVGSAFDVVLTGADDGCAGGAALSYTDQLEYVLYTTEAPAIRLAVDVSGEPVTFAAGEISGCLVSYGSVVWDEVRDGALIRWMLEGEANWRTSGDFGCSLEPDIDWEGTETITVVGSEHPDIGAGCTVELDVVGTYAGER